MTDVDLAPVRIAHFQVLEKLGQGGMGVVYKATDTRLRRSVALKVIRPDFADNEQRRARFLREARSAAAVTHANIAAIYDVGEENGRIYIAMELVEGRSLRQLLDDKGPLPIKTAVRIGKDIARGVAKAHEKGIIHRDLKPDNVMVTEELEVKVLDFGVAKMDAMPDADVLVAPDTESKADGATAEGKLVGTPGYMSPEQATGRPLDQRTDLFSLGVCLYEMVTGGRPFINSSTVAVLVATTCDTPEPPSKRNPLVLPPFERIIQRCLSKRPEDRYGSAAELLRDFELLEVPDPAASVPTLASSPRAMIAERTGAQPPRRRRKARPFIWGLAAMVAAGGLAFGALEIFGGGAPRTTVSAETTAPAPAPSATPLKTALPDLPAPRSEVPAALATYRTALLAFHDGNFEAFDHGMREAVRLDPSFAAGYLRVAFAKFHSVRGAVTDARKDLQQASRLRSQLSPRDQMVLDVLEPVINREPPDSDELERRLTKALETYPLDAELLYLRANEQRRYDVEASLATYERVLEIDPGFMTALRQKAQTLEMQRDVDGARRALDDCLKQVPGATGCRNERIWLNQSEGRCDLIEPDARQMIAADPDSFRAYDALARAQVSLGKPRAAVDEIFRQAWKRAPAEVRAREEALVSANLAVLAGRFEEARELAKAYEAAIASDNAAQVHATAALLRAEIEVETGDERGAARIAEDFLTRQIAWSGEPDGDTARLLDIERAGGVIDGARFQAARAEFIAGWLKQASRTRFPNGVVWVLAYGGLVANAEDAAVALRELSSHGPVPVGLRTAANDEALGRTYLLAGEVEKAIPPLAHAARSCFAAGDPFGHVRTHLLLGDALAAKGDKTGACEAYRAVMSRWGAARPRSLTATEAQARARRLGCKK